MKYLFLIIIALLAWGFLIEPHLLVVKHYKLKSETLQGLRIVFASDFHIGKYSKSRLKRIVKLINKQNANLVLLGGDFIKGHDGAGSLGIEEQALELAKIKAPVISVLGNHDGWYDKELVRDTLKEHGIRVLENSSVTEQGVCVAGVEDLQTAFPDIPKALKDTTSPRILLSHTPDIYYDVEEKVDLILAGHTHGGQICIPFFGAPVVPSKYGSKFAERIINDGKNLMIITKGLGTSILPVRINSVPEIVVIEYE